MKPRKTTASWRRWTTIAVAATAVAGIGTIVSNSMIGQPEAQAAVEVAEVERPSYLSELPQRTARALEAGVIAPSTIEDRVSARTVTAALSVAPLATVTAAAEPEEPEPELFRVTANGLNVRSGPSSDSGKLFVLQQDEAVQVAEIDGNWARVTTASGESGWAFQRYLAPTD